MKGSSSSINLPHDTYASSKGKKRKAPSEPSQPDARFNFSESDLLEDDPPLADDEDADAVEEGDALAGGLVEASTSKGLPSHLLPKSKKSGTLPGLIYLSRIPPGMGPFKVKHILAQHGEVGRVFLARSDPDPVKMSKRGSTKEKHREHKFAEGWVEFEDKRVARSVAEMLNANSIGGKKGSRWRDDVWTMKYLPRFRWDMLSEQVALERATQTSLLRFHLQNTRTEQETYLQAVEKSRVRDAMETKAESRREGKRLKGEVAPGGEGDDAGQKEKKKERERSYKQREVVGARKGDLDGVLNRLF